MFPKIVTNLGEFSEFFLGGGENSPLGNPKKGGCQGPKGVFLK
jgi:hypothetical protein